MCPFHKFAEELVYVAHLVNNGQVKLKSNDKKKIRVIRESSQM